MSSNEEKYQRDQATAFLSRWIRDSTSSIDSQHSANSRSGSKTFDRNRDCSSNSILSSSSINGMKERRCEESEEWGLQRAMGLLSHWGPGVYEEDHLNAEKHNDNHISGGSSSGIDDSKSFPPEAPNSCHTQTKQQPRKRVDQDDHLDARNHSSKHSWWSSCGIDNIMSSPPGVPTSRLNQPTLEQKPQPQALRETVAESPPRRQSCLDEGDKPSKLRTMHLAPANEHRTSLRVTPSSSPIVGNEIVSHLTWTEPVSGITGKYTGQINDQRHPHGYGALVYKDESATTSIWENGVPVQPWSPEDDKKKVAPPPPKNKTYVHKLRLGDNGTFPYIMPASSSQDFVLEKIHALKTHDFAFILRSNGQWKYAIIAERQEHFILFVVDTAGNAKKLEHNQWATSIRLVNPKEACNPEASSRDRRRRNASSKKKVCNKQKRETWKQRAASKKEHTLLD